MGWQEELTSGCLEGSSVLGDPARAVPFSKCFVCCGMPGEGGITCICPQGRGELCAARGLPAEGLGPSECPSEEEVRKE